MRTLIAVSVASILLAGALSAGPAAAQSAGAWVDTLEVPEQAHTYMSHFPTGDAFVYLHNRQTIWRSIDDGLTWLPVGQVPGGSGAFEMFSPSDGYFTDYDALYRTADGALTWERQPDLKGFEPRWNPTKKKGYEGYQWSFDSIAQVGDSKAVALGGELHYVDRKKQEGDVTCYSGDWEASVMIARDGGSSGRFRTTKLGFPGWVGRLGFLNDKVGWALAFEFDPEPQGEEPCGYYTSIRNVVLKTLDGGKTYEEILSCPHDGTPSACTSVAMVSKRRIVVGGADSWIYLSKNGGRGFEPQQKLALVEDPPIMWVSGIEFATSKIGYAVSNGGGTYRTDDAGLIWNLEPSSRTTWGLGVGDIAVGDTDHAIAGGPVSIVTRVGAGTSASGDAPAMSAGGAVSVRNLARQGVSRLASYDRYGRMTVGTLQVDGMSDRLRTTAGTCCEVAGGVTGP